MSDKILAEYIWIDGQKPTAKLRSKTKIVTEANTVADLPSGASTAPAPTRPRARRAIWRSSP